MTTLDSTAGARAVKDLTARTSSIELSQRIGSIAELTITWTADSTSQAGSLIALGETIIANGRKYVVGRRERKALVDGRVEVALRCRSVLAKALRVEYVVRAKSKVSASAWVKNAVETAGGKVIVEPSTTVASISQRGGSERSSTLKTIESLAGDLGWAWAEADGLITFAAGASLVAGTVPGISVASFALTGVEEWSSWDSDDAADAKAGGSLALPAGSAIDPMTVIDLTGAGVDSGRWLVESTTEQLLTEQPIQITVSRPRRPVARRKTSRQAGAASKAKAKAKDAPEVPW